MRRRAFLITLPIAAAGLAGMAALPGCAPRPRLRILMLGGTNFVGPHLVNTALAGGHQVTLFNRGVTNPELFADLELLRGNRYPDRDQGLSALETDRTWDAVIDTWAEEPGCVAATAELLADRVERYLYISSIAVYRRFREIGITEDGPLPDAAEHLASFESLSYPVRKRAAEQAVERSFGDQGTVLRCTSIQGYDHGARPENQLGYWAPRFLSGEPMLVPDDSTAVVQLIDVKDMARFAIAAIEQRLGGGFNLVGPTEPLPLLDYLAAWSAETGNASSMVRVDPAFLVARGVRPFDDLPYWIPADDPEPGFYRISNRKALAHGLSYRPLEETVRDGIASLPAGVGFEHASGGMPRERELELLDAWRAERA